MAPNHQNMDLRAFYPSLYAKSESGIKTEWKLLRFLAGTCCVQETHQKLGQHNAKKHCWDRICLGKKLFHDTRIYRRSGSITSNPPRVKDYHLLESLIGARNSSWAMEINPVLEMHQRSSFTAWKRGRLRSLPVLIRFPILSFRGRKVEPDVWGLEPAFEL